ncbi:putative nuclease HARBI1 [Leptopilina heterotoma]|uniref:putative nuclease HARBI1 n=1 Tax=Leptopilina heterotoma TaxID=63436 RepID=UPI001CA9A3D3|nr:putative nuclease HARBI1 [Leptopilina heterotoma]
MSQPMICRSIHEVTSLIDLNLAKEFVKFPISRSRRQEISNKFERIVGFPGIIGAVDCTFVIMISPSEEEHNHVNRHNQHAKNVQIVCDNELVILNVNAAHAGSSHDSFIWKNSAAREELNRSHVEGQSWKVLADSGYPLEPWTMTPILGARVNSPEWKYTKAHMQRDEIALKD